MKLEAVTNAIYQFKYISNSVKKKWLRFEKIGTIPIKNIIFLNI